MNDLPPLIQVPLPLTSGFIAANPNYLFVYGGAVRCDSEIGQASVCAQHPNTYDVPTRWSMCKSSGFFNDGQLVDIKWSIDMAISTIKRLHSDKPIIVLPKIGLGGSRMREFAPKAYEYLIAQLAQIAYLNVEFVIKDSGQQGSGDINPSLI